MDVGSGGDRSENSQLVDGLCEFGRVPGLAHGNRESDRAIVAEELDHTVTLIATDRVFAGHKIDRVAAVLVRRAAALDVDDLRRGKHILRSCAWISQAPD